MPPTAGALARGLRLAPQVLMMFRAFLASPQRTTLLLLGGAIVAVIGFTALGQIRLNAWNQPFYDALTRKILREFLDQTKVFAMLAGGLLILNVTQAWLSQMTKLKLREGVVCDLLNEWLKPRRAFQLVFARLSLRKPLLVVIDEALHALQDDARLRMTNLFLDGLKDVAVLNIGRPETSSHLFKRMVRLIDDPLGRCFIPDLGNTLADQPIAAPANHLAGIIG